MSEREPELGLGVVANVDAAAKRIAIEFPATGERRLYALGTAVLKRVQFRAGDTVRTRDGGELTIETVEEAGGVLSYVGSAGQRVREDAISDVTSVDLPQERLLAGQTDEGAVFDLRFRALQMQAKIRQSEVRGFLGGRIDLIPHQFYILAEVSSRQIPRVLLADEVGLGKTIEACLILQRLLAVGKVQRALVLVPESLTHQWFVELLRRFNLWFSIYDEERCVTDEAGDPEANPFLGSQLALAGVSFLARDERRRAQVIAAGWDIVVVDEAHHLAWSPPKTPSSVADECHLIGDNTRERTRGEEGKCHLIGDKMLGGGRAEYALVEELAGRTPGLLLLTATPMQLGPAGHFARLRLLDPERYPDFEAFQREAEGFGTVAKVAEKIVEQKPLAKTDRAALGKIFDKDPAGLAARLDALEQGKPGAREALLKTLLDQHGTGRVMFRNTRAAMSGFPSRKFCPARIEDNNLTLHARIARELAAEETGGDAGLRYSLRDDPRIEWLAELLKESKPAKILLICRTQRKVAAIEAALQERIAVKTALFHEGLPLVQRDRHAAWFAEPDGAQLLICSEIGSEGRNFQFAHQLVLFDLPLNPGLVEQRIGRLDRIGQTQTIRVHVPYVAGSADEAVVEWYHRGLDAIETPRHGGSELMEEFRERLLALALDYGGGKAHAGRPALEAFVAETAAYRKELDARMKKGRDRLLELNSFNPAVAARAIAEVRAADADPALRTFLLELLDHFGVRVREHEEGDVLLDPSHAYIESFPSIPAEGMLATFDRKRAIVREDIRFLSADHGLVRDAIDLLIESKAGTTAFGFVRSDEANLLLEGIYVLETVADSRWHVDQFLAPTPVRVLVDLRGEIAAEGGRAPGLAGDFEDGVIQRFLERPGFNASVLKQMVETAGEAAERRANPLKRAATEKARAALGAEVQRLVELGKLNDHVRPEEIALAKARLEQTVGAIGAARLRLDALRLVVEGGGEE